MPHFESMVEQKLKLREALLQNQNVVNLLVNAGNNVVDFEDIAVGRKSPASDLVRTYFFVPDTQQKDKNFIAMRSSVDYANTDVVKETRIIVYVICNEDQINLLQGSRADLIANEIDKILNNGDKTLFGLGGVRIGIAEEIHFGDMFIGWQIPYITHEFNRKADVI